MRKLKRMIARNRMKQMGISKINKHEVGKGGSVNGKSYFANHWRDFVR